MSQEQATSERIPKTQSQSDQESKQSTKTVILMRGLPGSGKTTLAREFVDDMPDGSSVILSTDEYFMVAGHYCFDHTRLREAHDWNQWRCKRALRLFETVIIDNTNVRLQHMLPYERIADRFGAEIEYATPTTRWAFDAEECSRLSTNKVPLYIVRRFLEEWEDLPNE